MGASSLSLDDSPAVQLAGKVTMIAFLLLFFVLLLLLCLHLYAKRYYSDNNPTSPAEAPKLRGGLEASVIDSLTLIVVGCETEQGLECAVCLSDVAEGDKARLLPKCHHKFHADCIDIWFQSHSTCPLCRGSVVAEPSSLLSGFSSESPVFPTNVLFWGDHTRVSSGGPGHASSSDARNEGMSAIGIVPSEESRTGTGEVGGGEEELKSPVVATRLRSLKRLLSRDRRNVSACSPSAAAADDVEEGRA